MKTKPTSDEESSLSQSKVTADREKSCKLQSSAWVYDCKQICERLTRPFDGDGGAISCTSHICIYDQGANGLATF